MDILTEGENTQRVRDDYKDDKESTKQDYERDLEDAEKKDLETRQDKRNEGKLSEDWKDAPGYSSREAGKIMDQSLRGYAKILRKAEYKVIKDWMSKAKAGVLDFFDIEKGLTRGDASRAHPEETQFLHKILTKDKILNRFRSYFGGKKGKPRGK